VREQGEGFGLSLRQINELEDSEEVEASKGMSEEESIDGKAPEEAACATLEK